jgi:hypothetical protein
MANPADVGASKAARRMFGKKGVDVSQADVRVAHGVCTIRGVISLLKGHDGDVKTNTLEVANILKRRADVKDVVVDVTYRGEGQRG